MEYHGGNDERQLVSSLYKSTLIEILSNTMRLTFNRVGWDDDDASKLALVLPLCSSLRELHLGNNRIGDQAMIMLTQELPRLRYLEVLNVSSNVIGDPGVSRLSGAFTDGVCKSSLKVLDMGSNHIGDKGAMALSSAISGGAIRNCKKVSLKGNPVSTVAKKSVGKALKKGQKAKT